MTAPEAAVPSPPPLEPGLASREAWQAEVAKRRQIGDSALSHFQEPHMLKNVDEELGDLSVRYAAMHNLILASAQTPQEHRTMLKHVAAVEAAAQGERPVFEGNPFLDENADKVQPLIDTRPIVLADPEVRDIINRRDLSTAHEALVQEWPRFVEMYTAGLHKGVELGYIPAETEERLQAGLTKTSVRVVDDSLLKALDPRMSAYYNNTSDEVGVTHKNEVGWGFSEDLAHELGHKLSGGTFVAPVTESGEHRRPRVGFSTELPTKEINRTGLNEAVNHHVTLGILTGDFETINPDQREHDDHTYYGYRRVLGDFIDKSRGGIQVRTLTSALFEDTGTEGNTQQRRQFAGQVVRSYGLGALRKLDTLMDLTNLVEEDDYEKRILSRIHPPEVDDQGNVTKPGSIDMENLPTLADLLQAEHEDSKQLA